MNSRSRTPFGNSPPDKCHVTIPADKLKPGRLIIIGDVHGCLNELNELLEACEYQPDKDNLVLAGDVVNKGPLSVEALRRARQLEAIVIRGNHEDACLALKKRVSLVASVASSYKWLKQLTKDDVAYLEQLPFTVTLPSYNTIIVHAGFVPDGTSVQMQSMKNMLFLEDADPDSADSKKFKCHYKTRHENKSWARFWTGLGAGPYHAFFGHACGKDVQQYTYATGLDTGCVSGGTLTACILPAAADLQQLPQYQQYLSSTSSTTSAGGSLSRPPTLAELGAELKSVHRSFQPGKAGLQPVFSTDLCSSSFARPDDPGQDGMQPASSLPTPGAGLPAGNAARLERAATSHHGGLERRSKSMGLPAGS